MRRLGALLAVFCLVAPGILASAQTAPSSARRVVNVTTDSTPGWLPSETLEAEALSTLTRYFRAYDKSDDRAVWNSLTDGLKALQTSDQYAANSKRTRKEIGRLKRLDVVKLTWTKDPANAPSPGIYVAIDIVGQFAKARRQCGFVVLFKANPTDPFRLARIESNFMTDEAYSLAVKERTPAGADRIWAQLSANCPNYPGAR